MSLLTRFGLTPQRAATSLIDRRVREGLVSMVFLRWGLWDRRVGGQEEGGQAGKSKK